MISQFFRQGVEKLWLYQITSNTFKNRPANWEKIHIMFEFFSNCLFLGQNQSCKTRQRFGLVRAKPQK